MEILSASIRLISIGFVSFFAALPAWAESDSVDMAVAATTVDSCRVSATTMNFGDISGLTGRPTTTATIALTCTPNTEYTIAIDSGLHHRGARARRMFNPTTGRYMRYNIYSNAALTNRWDDRRRRQVTGNTGATGVAIHTAYGQIRSLASVSAGSGVFADTVTITVEF